MSGIFMKSKGEMREVRGAQAEAAQLQDGVRRPAAGCRGARAGGAP